LKPFLIGVAGLSGSGKTALARKLGLSFGGGADARRLLSSAVAFVARRARAPEFRSSRRARLGCFVAPGCAHAAAKPSPSLFISSISTRAPHPRDASIRRPYDRRGILALHHAGVRNQLDLCVFVTTRDEECLRRRLERDIAEGVGRAKACWSSITLPYGRWRCSNVLPSREHANLVVSGEEPLDESVAAVLRVARNASRRDRPNGTGSDVKISC